MLLYSLSHLFNRLLYLDLSNVMTCEVHYFLTTISAHYLLSHLVQVLGDVGE
jgi:hypothetical protein